jgi:GNAT superfamily N-acetyltransferase
MPYTLDDLDLVCLDPETHCLDRFDCGDSDLNDFLQSDAARYQSEHLSHTRLAFLKGSETLVGYITLLADCIILKTPEKKRVLSFLRRYHQHVYTFPSLKIGRLGVARTHQRGGFGKLLLQYTVGLAVRLNRELNVGCRFITVDAYPKSIPWYEKNGFALNKHYRRPETTHPSMRFDILKSPEIR